MSVFYFSGAKVSIFIYSKDKNKAKLLALLHNFSFFSARKSNNNAYIRPLIKTIEPKRRIMIEYIKGEIAELSPATAVVDCNGLGYGINISLNTYAAIQGKKECKLYIYEAIREDAYVLYGFADKQERELFLLLISVSGIGGNTARMILSALSPSELVNVISTENANMLKSVKGIGLKTAQRIIVELKDKIKTGSVAAGSSGSSGMPMASANAQVQEEAIAALTMLGFAQAPSQKVVLAILKEEPNAAVEQVIKLALKRL